VLRKSPEFKKFHNFLVFETEVVSPLKSVVVLYSVNFIFTHNVGYAIREISRDKKLSVCFPHYFSTCNLTIGYVGG
jgi:hypothetical protein